MKLIEKAFILDMFNIKDNFLYSPIIVHAENVNKAKTKILEKCKYDFIETKMGDILTYKNINVKRHHDYDKYIYDGETKLKYQIEEIKNIKKHNKNLDKILKDDNITHCYIMKRGSYYCDNYCGYTQYKYKAGIYFKEAAVKHCRNIIELKCIPIDITEHNKYISKYIDILNKKLIKIN